MSLFFSVLLIGSIVFLFIQGWILLGVAGQSGRILLRLDLLKDKLAMPSLTPKTTAQKDDVESNGARNGFGGRAPVVPHMIGVPAPVFQLPDLDGTLTSSRSFLGRRVLVFFWNSDCALCRKLLEDLTGWESTASVDAPQLLILASGDVGFIWSTPLRASILVDESFSTSRRLGTTGTPAALLIDARGNVASEMARGESAVRALFRQASGDVERAAPIPSTL